MFSASILYLCLSTFPLVVAGYFISSRRMGFYVDAIAHSTLAFFSILIFLLATWTAFSAQSEVWISILGVGLAGALISFRLFDEIGTREPWMGEIFVGSMAIAGIFLSKMPIRGIDFDSLFMGQFLLIKPVDLNILVVLNLCFLLAYLIFAKRWHLFFADKQLFRHLYGQDRLSLFVLFFLMSALIGFLVQSVGIILAFAWLVFPARMASRLVAGLSKILWLSAIGILLLGAIGLALSYVLDFPTGPTCAVLWVVLEVVVSSLTYKQEIGTS